MDLGRERCVVSGAGLQRAESRIRYSTDYQTPAGAAVTSKLKVSAFCIWYRSVCCLPFQLIIRFVSRMPAAILTLPQQIPPHQLPSERLFSQCQDRPELCLHSIVTLHLELCLLCALWGKTFYGGGNLV